MRIVQDSEDEDELELDDVEPVGRDAPQASPRVDHSPHALEAGTGSTGELGDSNSYRRAQLAELRPDSLKRTIEAAHRAHLQSPSGKSAESSHLSIASVIGHDSKRRKTSSGTIAVESHSMNPSSTEAHVIYGNSNLHDAISEQPPEGSEPRQMATAEEKAWDLQGTIAEQWQHHKPTSLFSEPSSTVPNATATQRQLLGDVIAPAYQGNDAESDAPPYEPAKSSIPWSEYLKSSARNTQDRSELDNQVDPPSDHCQSTQSQSGRSSNTRAATPPQAQTPKLSQRNRQGSLPLRGSPLCNEVLQDCVDLQEPMGPPPINSRAPHVEISQDGSPARSRAKSRPSDSPNMVDDPQLSPLRLQKTQQETVVVSPAAKSKQSSKPTLSSEDDALAIGLPPEEYKPRPSRSRSLKLTTQESIDYSVRPEKAAKKPRRSRTTGETTSLASTPEKIQKICDMGFTPSTTQKALRQNNGDVTSTVDWLVANDVAEDELAPARPSKSKEKTKPHTNKKGALNVDTPATEISASEHQDLGTNFSKPTETNAVSSISDEGIHAGMVEENPVVVPTKSPKVSVVIPRSKGQHTSPKSDLTKAVTVTVSEDEIVEGTSRKAKRRKTTSDSTEGVIDAVTVDTPKNERRGRGRPRKEPKSTEPEPDKRDNDRKCEATDVSTVLQELQHTAGTVNTTTDADTARAIMPISPHLHSAQLSVTSPGAALETSKAPSENPEKVSKPATSKDSPLNKAKTPYRVGLSKRARIAPLLRVVKK